MTTYTCPEKNCDVVIEGNDTIREILKHEKIHYKKKKIIEKVEIKDCEHCNGRGTVSETYLVEEDELSETD